MAALLAAGGQSLAGGAARVLAAEAAGFAAAAALATVRRGGWTLLPLGVVVAAEAVRAHPNGAAPGWGAALTAVHLAATAAWAGTLAHVLRAVIAWRSHRSALWWLASVYSRLAGWLVAVVAATGITAGLLLVPLPRLATTGYGQLLLAKLALVAAAVVVAGLARRRLRAGPARVGDVAARARLEAGLLAGVLAVTAVLVSTPTPRLATTAPITPPAPVGPVLPLGILAGQVGVTATASAGQLVVRLSTPTLGDDSGGQPETAATGLAARLTPANQATGAHRGTRALALRGCGTGCYLAAAGWATGDNLLTLHPTAGRWHTATVALLVDWPPRPGAALLARAVAATRAAGHLTVYETVTSDTTTPTPPAQTLALDAGFFLGQEPYGTGVAPQVVLLPTPPGGTTRLALGFPAEHRTVTLTLDAQHRVGDETLADDSHLIRRHFTYPDPG
jgi:copper transport protein